jgi:hypothetical protein
MVDMVAVATVPGGLAMNRQPDGIGCTVKTLPPELSVEAARVAVDIYPANAPPLAQFASTIPGDESDVIYMPQRIAALTDRYWGPKPRVIPVQFLDGPDAATARMILEHANAWDCGITFVESRAEGVVRITRGPGGFWSYLGTDVKMVSGPTMNLQGFTSRTSPAEYRRVVTHEFGHTLGFPHEHMRRELVSRLHREKTISYFARTQGWSRRDVELQVLTPLDEASVMGTPADEDSVMCYQLPGSITIDGRPIPGGDDLTATDLAFVDAIYPLPAGPVEPPSPPPHPPPVEPPEPEPKPPVEPEPTDADGFPLEIGERSEEFTCPSRGKVRFYFRSDRRQVVSVEVFGPGTWAMDLTANGKPVPTDDPEKRGRSMIYARVPKGLVRLDVRRKHRILPGRFKVEVTGR